MSTRIQPVLCAGLPASHPLFSLVHFGIPALCPCTVEGLGFHSPKRAVYRNEGTSETPFINNVITKLSSTGKLLFCVIGQTTLLVQQSDSCLFAPALASVPRPTRSGGESEVAQDIRPQAGTRFRHPTAESGPRTRAPDNAEEHRGQPALSFRSG